MLSILCSRTILSASPRHTYIFGQLSCLSSTLANDNVRGRLTADLKTAMKAKDTFTSTTIRSVLAEVYAADKKSTKLSDSGVVSIIRKAVTRRADSAAQFIAASRPELAEAETREATLLSTFLPALMSQEDVDRVLHEILARPDINPKRAVGQILKAFYSQVDKSIVDGQMVKQRADAVVSATSV